MNNKNTIMASVALATLFIGIMAIMTIHGAYASSKNTERAINKTVVEMMS